MAITKNMVSDNKHVVNQIVTLSKELLFILFMVALVLVLKPTTANAATLNVATGNGATNLGDSLCQIEEAITNINDQTRTVADCVETGTYGTDDTINLPNGTIDGSMMIGSGSGSGIEPVVINKSVKILGQGRDSSTIRDLRLEFPGSGASFSLKDFAIKGEATLYSEGSESLTIDSLEVDFEGNAGYFLVVNPHNLTIKNSYIHNINNSETPAMLTVYAGSTEDWNDNQATVIITDSTFSDSNSNSGIYMGMGGSSVATLNAAIKNNTFSNMESNNSSMIAGLVVVAGGSSNTLNYTTINNTFKDITGQLNGSGNPTAMAIAEASFENGKINHTAQNDVYSSGNGTAVNYYQYLGESSVESDLTTTSLGGNISSDNSFGSRLNHATDQNNITTLASFLGTLGDNGGPVPTISLLANSPAIDSGTNVSGMTTDARGVTRPQGTAFDSGAYELEQSTPENPGGSESGSAQNTTTVVNPGLTSPTSSVSQFSNKPITISTPTGTTITSSNTVTESSLANQDGNNQYPLGLVNFTFNTSQTDNQVTLTFITDLKPNQVKPRKYNPDSKAYTDLTNYTLTETTINGQHALVLTYTITDNGDLDTNKTTGIISDPVGLAMSNSTYDQLANTGQESLIAGLVAGLTMIAGSIALITTRLKDKVRYSFKR